VSVSPHFGIVTGHHIIMCDRQNYHTCLSVVATCGLAKESLTQKRTLCPHSGQTPVINVWQARF